MAPDRLWLQIEPTPNLLQRLFCKRTLLLGEPTVFGEQPKSLLLFWAELLQSHAHKRELNPLEPIRRFARLHAEILPPSSRNLPQGREKRKCLPRFGQRAGVASAGEVLKRDRVYASRLRIPADCPHDSARKIGFACSPERNRRRFMTPRLAKFARCGKRRRGRRTGLACVGLLSGTLSLRCRVV
jgi:hypothetical protein